MEIPGQFRVEINNHPKGGGRLQIGMADFIPESPADIKSETVADFRRNPHIRDWTELLAGDEVLATAILDRLLHRAHVLNIKGRSYRLRDLEEALRSKG